MPDLFGDPTPDPNARTIRVWADTVRRAICRGDDCDAHIWFAEAVKTGRQQPYDGEPVALRIEQHDNGRPIWVIDLDMAHHITCLNATDFRKRDAGSKVDTRTPSERRIGLRRYEGHDDRGER